MNETNDIVFTSLRNEVFTKFDLVKNAPYLFFANRTIPLVEPPKIIIQGAVYDKYSQEYDERIKGLIGKSVESVEIKNNSGKKTIELHFDNNETISCCPSKSGLIISK